VNRQHIFNEVAVALVAQGVRSVSEDNRQCRYRGAGGTKCAMGHLIPDELYSADFEGMLASSLLISSRGRDIAHLLSVNTNPNESDDLMFLDDLQRCHDRAEYGDFNAEIRERLATFGKSFQLDTSILERI
jgi:hypothetical protein